MTAGKPVAAAIVGCGDVAAAYGNAVAAHPGIELRGATDRNPPRVAAFAERFGGIAYPSIDALLEDPAVELVVNLGRQTSHYEVNRRCLEAGKHVFSEKPLATRREEATELVELARGRGLRLGCAPIVQLGAAQRTLARLVREGELGTVRVAYAEGNWGLIERWHPRPLPFYEVGPAVDVGVYALTLITSIFGRAARVCAAESRTLQPVRATRDGTPFTLDGPDWTTAVVELESGAIVRLTASFFVGSSSRQKGIELHGDRGSAHIASLYELDAAVALAREGGPYEPVPLDAAPVPAMDYAYGPVELAAAIRAGRPHEGSGEQAAHVVEVLEAIAACSRGHEAIDIESGCEVPA